MEGEENRPGDPPPQSDSRDELLILDSRDFMAGRREVWIRHGDEMYRLRLTSAGKLYLTK